ALVAPGPGPGPAGAGGPRSAQPLPAPGGARSGSEALPRQLSATGGPAERGGPEGPLRDPGGWVSLPLARPPHPWPMSPMNERQPGRAPLPARPRKWAWVLAGVTLAGLVGALVWWLAPARPLPDDHRPGEPYDPTPRLAGPPWYREVTGGSGLDFTYRNG